MCRSIRIALVCVVAALAAGETFAAESEPLLGKPGKLLFEDDFARPTMRPKWLVGKGTWTIKDGSVTVAEIPEDRHRAYAYIIPSALYKDIVAEYSFKLGGADRLHLMLDDNKYQGSHAGHIIGVSILPKSVELMDMKNGPMNNALREKLTSSKTTPAEKKEVQETIKSRIASYPASFDPAAWHQARVEVVGDEMLMSIDGSLVGYFKAEGIDHPTKNKIGMTVDGKTAEIRNVKIWEATPAPGWTGRRAEVVGSLKK